MFLKSILINLLLVASVYCGIFRNKRSSNNKCIVKLASDNENELEPLVIFNNCGCHRIVYQHIDIEIEMNESVWLSCAPFKLQQFPDKQFVEATCTTEQTLEIDGIEIEFSDLKCEQGVIQNYQHPVDGCKANEEYKSVKSVQQSIYDPIHNISYVTREICYDDVKENIIFIHGNVDNHNDLQPLSFQNGEFILPLYKPSMNNLTKSMQTNIAKLREWEADLYTDTISIADYFLVLLIPAGPVFLAQTNYRPEATFDFYLGRFGEDNIIPHTFNYWWTVMKNDERAVGVIGSEKKLSFDVNKIFPGREVDGFLKCKYDDMQKIVFGIPELKFDWKIKKKVFRD